MFDKKFLYVSIQAGSKEDARAGQLSERELSFSYNEEDTEEVLARVHEALQEAA